MAAADVSAASRSADSSAGGAAAAGMAHQTGPARIGRRAGGMRRRFSSSQPKVQRSGPTGNGWRPSGWCERPLVAPSALRPADGAGSTAGALATGVVTRSLPTRGRADTCVTEIACRPSRSLAAAGSIPHYPGIAHVHAVVRSRSPSLQRADSSAARGVHACCSVLTVCCALALPPPLAAQEAPATGRIAGRVIDAESGQGIAGVGVQIVGTTHRRHDRRGRQLHDRQRAGRHRHAAGAPHRLRGPRRSPACSFRPAAASSRTSP